MNIGVMFFRHSAQTQKFVDDWYERIVATPDLWDQNAFNEMARQGWDPYVKAGAATTDMPANIHRPHLPL
eukprot:356387-Chlamydomonas_euryale.AAC.2